MSTTSGDDYHKKTIQRTMKKLSETYKELGIAFTFPIEIRDANGNETYREFSDGFWYKWEYAANGNETYFETSNDYWCRWDRDANGNETYLEDSKGTKRGTPRSAKTCDGKGLKVDNIQH